MMSELFLDDCKFFNAVFQMKGSVQEPAKSS